MEEEAKQSLSITRSDEIATTVLFLLSHRLTKRWAKVRRQKKQAQRLLSLSENLRCDADLLDVLPRGRSLRSAGG